MLSSHIFIHESAVWAVPLSFWGCFDVHAIKVEPLYDATGIFAVNHLTIFSSYANVPNFWSFAVLLNRFGTWNIDLIGNGLTTLLNGFGYVNLNSNSLSSVTNALWIKMSNSCGNRVASLAHWLWAKSWWLLSWARHRDLSTDIKPNCTCKSSCY